jgi:1-acyl-sn-glycerol-3-phosphate acyltransferase
MTRAMTWCAGVSAGALSFLYLIFVLNSVQMASVVFYPFSKRLFRAINRWCARSIWGWWVLMAERQNRIQIRFTGDPIPRRENALLVPNHQSMADVMVLLCCAWRCRRLGDVKFFVKDVVKWFPGFGWGMKFLDCVFVKRDWAKDKGSIEKLFAKYKREDIPIFLVSFLEGTRRTDRKHADAKRFAEERGLYCPEHTLIPRTKGFVATMIGLRDHLDSVYDLTIGYPDGVPSLVNCFEAKVKHIEVHVRRFPVDTLPTDEDELESWVFERFREKDRLLAELEHEKKFPGEPLPDAVRLMDWFRAEA